MIEILILTIERDHPINDDQIKYMQEQITEIGGNLGLSSTKHVRIKTAADYRNDRKGLPSLID